MEEKVIDSSVVYYAANALISRYKSLARIDQHKEELIKAYGQNYVFVREEVKRILRKKDLENRLQFNKNVLTKKKRANLQNKIKAIQTDADVKDVSLPPLMIRGVRIRPELSIEQIAKLLRREFKSLSNVKERENYLIAILGAAKTNDVFIIIEEMERISAERAARRAVEKARKDNSASKTSKQSKKQRINSVSEDSRKVYKSIASTYSENDRVSRRAMELFEKMKEVGFHKCGKRFKCSCCGGEFVQNQGIVSDVGEIYLCNHCRGGQKGNDRNSKSVYAISIPMGGKNK